jgi:hypothetical protein
MSFSSEFTLDSLVQDGYESDGCVSSNSSDMSDLSHPSETDAFDTLADQFSVQAVISTLDLELTSDPNNYTTLSDHISAFSGCSCKGGKCLDQIAYDRGPTYLLRLYRLFHSSKLSLYSVLLSKR